MSQIKSVFHQSSQLDRQIEKVIQYDMRGDEQLRSEVSEYIVTENIHTNFRKLLDKVDEGMGARTNEIGVWVSGFYGSGKSSFTKYFGFALDLDRTINGTPFLEHLQDRIRDTRLSQRFSTVAKRHNPTVLMLDLASDQLAEENADIASVLYAKVKQWAGYSQDRKISYLEKKLEMDGQLEEFEDRVRKNKGISWDQVKNQKLTANRVASDLAHEFYPETFRHKDDLKNMNVDEAISENDRAEDMINLIQERSGNGNIIFILDEVGQYVASKDSLILNLQGLAQNLKQIGDGNIWLVATAQQTLTEDDPRARVNSANLFKLKDRFQVEIDLEASDIREICNRRLLEKSSEGQETLESLFDEHGQKLRLNTKLEGASVYESDDLEKGEFRELYPFLPQHFTILLELLGRLSKSTGGTGLRSAIKIVQDVLIDRDSVRSGMKVLANRELGTLATTVTFYDTLRRDIDQSFAHVAKGVEDVVKAFGEESTEADVAKTVAILQILENCPATRSNVSALLHPSIEATSQEDRVDTAAENLLGDDSIRISEVDGALRFLSEKVKELEEKRKEIVPGVREHRRIRNNKIKEIFTPLPKANIHGAKQVQAGLKLNTSHGEISIQGDNREVQLVLDLVAESQYEATKQEYVQKKSTQDTYENTIFLVARKPDLDDTIDEIYRSEQIFERNRGEKTDKKISDYLNGQRQRAEKLRRRLERELRDGMVRGSFVFRGKPTPVESLSSDLNQAASQHLTEIAKDIYSKFDQAAINPKRSLAEKFLKADLKSIKADEDPLGLVQSSGKIDTSDDALRSILDYLKKRGQVEGGKLQDDFSTAPFGWSKDTLRYLVAALLTDGEIKLRAGGSDVTVRSDPKADEHLSSNRSFRRVGVSLRDQPFTNEQLDRAATHLVELTGGEVLPTEEEIGEAVREHFPRFDRQYASLPSRLRSLGVPGAQRAEEMKGSISEIIQGGAVDAIARLGSEEADLVDDLQWARKLKDALDAGKVEEVVKKASRVVEEIPELPNVGPMEKLREETEQERGAIEDILSQDTFFERTDDLQSELRKIDSKIDEAVQAVRENHQEEIAEKRQQLENKPHWERMDPDEQQRISNELGELALDIASGLEGLRQYNRGQIEVRDHLGRIEEQIEELGEIDQDDESRHVETLKHLRREYSSPEELDSVIKEFQQLKQEFENHDMVVIDW
jgi:hypothetical protein